MSRFLFIAFAIIFLIIAVYAVAVTLYMRGLISESTALVDASRPYQQKGTGHPRILVLGDSTAVGTGTKDNKGSTAGRFGQDFPNAEIINLSINGLKAAELDDDFPTFPEDSFDLVLLQIGANDILRRTPLTEFSVSLRSIFSKADAVGGRVVALHSGNVGLAPLFRFWPLRTYFRSQSLRMRDVYRGIASESGVTYVDLFREAKDDLFLTDVPKYYAADRLHLTEEGYGNWYLQIRTAMDLAGIALR
jgi:lysophospholipase L1-like esterase